MRCPGCGTETPDTARFCPSCGRPAQADVTVSGREQATVLAPASSGFGTPQDARRLTEQVQGEVNQMMEDHEKQLKQNMDSQTP